VLVEWYLQGIVVGMVLTGYIFVCYGHGCVGLIVLRGGCWRDVTYMRVLVVWY
jgi:hypothetical protein